MVIVSFFLGGILFYTAWIVHLEVFNVTMGDLAYCGLIFIQNELKGHQNIAYGHCLRFGTGIN